MPNKTINRRAVAGAAPLQLHLGAIRESR